MIKHECFIAEWVTNRLHPVGLKLTENKQELAPLLSQTVQRLVSLTQQEGFIIADPEGLRGINRIAVGFTEGLYGDTVLWSSERQDVIVLSGIRGKYEVALSNQFVHMARNINPTSNLSLDIIQLTDNQIKFDASKSRKLQMICQAQVRSENSDLNWRLLTANQPLFFRVLENPTTEPVNNLPLDKNSLTLIEKRSFLSDLFHASVDYDATRATFAKKRAANSPFKIIAWKDSP